MSGGRLRDRIAWEAARLIVHHQEQKIYRARMAAARRVSSEPVHPRDLPSNREINDQIVVLSRMERDAPSNSGVDGILLALSESEPHLALDRFVHYRELLLPLEKVRQKPEKHPEGDALYHSLQVFQLACHELPYDEEFLLAALLHDVGKAIDPQDHIGAGLEALAGHITPRTAWLIEHHTEANMLRDGALGARSSRRLRESESFEELMLLSKCDREGRVAGVATPDVDEALEYVRELAESCGE